MEVIKPKKSVYVHYNLLVWFGIALVLALALVITRYFFAFPAWYVAPIVLIFLYHQ